MLVEYSFGNFKSFKDSNTLSMLGVKSFKEHGESNVFTQDKFRILKSAVVYGNNASGKSNLVLGLSVMKNIVLTSFRNALDEKGSLFVEKFLLNTKSESIPSNFEVVFFQKDVRYRYGFEINDGKVIEEWLYHNPGKKEVPLFERDVKGIDYLNKTSFGEGEEYKDKNKLRNNVLFISLIAQFNENSKSNEVVNWFKNVNIVSGINDLLYSRYTYDKFMNDDDFKNWLSRIVQCLEIANIEIADVDTNDGIRIGNSTVKLSMVSENTEGQKYKHSIKSAKITTWHKKYDENNLLIGAVPFDFNMQESEGTKKFINLLGPWYDTIKNGKVLIIDELDSRLHTGITKALIDFFNHSRNKNAQLIFTSHDVNLLDKDFLRRDQIWFVEKNQFGESSLYSLADFKAVDVRNTSSFVNNYLNGKYGAVPYLDIKGKIEDLIYG
jgi:AAA15 family ATPase/GTPase